MASHLDAIEVECPECEAAPGERCIREWCGASYLTDIHAVRQERADLHELHHNPVPDSDVIAVWCQECEYEDAI